MAVVVAAAILPTPWTALVLALAAFRLLRLLGWDDFPPVLNLRQRIIGEEWVRGDDPGLPGKGHEALANDVRPAYRRPLLAHFVYCPFCLGFWVSCFVYTAWLLFPTQALYAAAPFALSAAIGLAAKNLDR